MRRAVFEGMGKEAGRAERWATEGMSGRRTSIVAGAAGGKKVSRAM